MIELWLAGPEGAYADEYRATVITDENGAYRFESHPPPPYSGRPSHIHIRVTAPGYQELVTQHYPQSGLTGAVFDLVIQPE
jgi:protocatechuate 3,4-dioxygenase beta subunit